MFHIAVGIMSVSLGKKCSQLSTLKKMNYAATVDIKKKKGNKRW
ncbi:hypothetical protein [Bacillus subtilis]